MKKKLSFASGVEPDWKKKFWRVKLWIILVPLAFLLMVVAVTKIIELNNLVEEIGPEEAYEMNATFFDLSSIPVYNSSHVAGAKNYPLSDNTCVSCWKKHFILYDLKKTYILYGGDKIPLAVQELKSLGFENIYSLKGGLDAWTNSGLPTESSS